MPKSNYKSITVSDKTYAGVKRLADGSKISLNEQIAQMVRTWSKD